MPQLKQVRLQFCVCMSVCQLTYVCTNVPMHVCMLVGLCILVYTNMRVCGIGEFATSNILITYPNNYNGKLKEYNRTGLEEAL